ncbi:type IV secretion system protein [Aggregatibacter actinomycetemcomitans]|uniref:type IV secretion system protein n=1 Tax=Aggregatibacter actinomycetemcomitans TaxID=714 RepID=UPI00197C483B|nr:type IV secretion system protein [Aggregatibacter actinomycetemcomitans]MBN6078475.1 type IV secretion system protein [Aggregatibacter actinomycetemcomitans]
MNITIFAEIGESINEVINKSIGEVRDGYISDIILLAKVSITLYLTIYGYAVLSGKRSPSIGEFLWDCARFAIILTFLEKGSDYLKLVDEAVDGLKGFFAGGENTYSLIDKKLSAISDIITDIWAKADGIEGTFKAFLNVIGMLPLLIGFVSCGSLIIYSEIIVKILLAVFPIFLFCLMWGFLKDTFSAWLNAVLGNAFVILFVAVILDVSIELAKLAQQATGFWISLLSYIIAGLISISAIKWGRETAISLAQVSVDRAIGGASNSINNKEVSLAKQGAAKVGQSAAQGARTLLNYLRNIK